MDACCFLHDHCAVHIEPGETKFGNTNIGKYTQVSCQCDAAFDKCLRDINSWSAWAVIGAFGLTYPECIIQEHALSCISPGGDYKLNPCAGFRCSSDLTGTCDVVEKWVKADSRFKIHQLEKDREEAKKQRNRMMPIPSAVHIINRTP